MSILSARTLRLAVPLAAIGLALALAAPASAATVSPVNTTYDRPGITLVPGGNFEIAWAGTDTNGEINGAMVNANGVIIPGTKWTDSSSASQQGTGATIVFDPGLDFSLIAWTDLGTTNLGTKYVETNHATTTDMGSTTFTLDPQGAAFFTYCGTNNVVYGQWFLGTGPETEIALGGSCNIYTNPSGFINGGVDVTYDSATSSFDYLFPNEGNLALILNAY